MEQEITAKSYTLRTENGAWLGQIVLTSDGMFSAVTDYGNAGYAWRAYGNKGFRQFLISINADYFGGKLYNGMTYMGRSKAFEKACMRFAEMILPALQKVLKEEIELGNEPEQDFNSFMPVPPSAHSL